MADIQKILAQMAVRIVHVCSLPRHVAGIGLAQTCENPKQACLAAAIVSVDPQDLAGLKREFDASKEGTVASPAPKLMAD